MTEQWRQVVGYEDLYEISDFGRVKSLSRIVASPFGAGSKLIRERILKQSRDRHGRLYVYLFNLGKSTTFLVHRLVLIAFVGTPGDGQEACHWNGNCADNSLDNLRWDTRHANRQDARRLGEIPLGVERPFAKLNEDSVRVARAWSADGIPMWRIALALGVGPSTIQKAVARTKWSHVL